MKQHIYTRTFSFVHPSPTVQDFQTTDLPTVVVVENGRFLATAPPRYFPVTFDDVFLDVALCVCESTDRIKTYQLSKLRKSPIVSLSIMTRFSNENGTVLCCYIVEASFEIPPSSFAWTVVS